MLLTMDSDELPKPIDIKDAINFTSVAWQNVTRETVRNCWINTGILPDGFLDEYLTDDSELVLMLSEKFKILLDDCLLINQWTQKSMRVIDDNLTAREIPSIVKNCKSNGSRFGNRAGILLMSSSLST